MQLKEEANYEPNLSHHQENRNFHAKGAISGSASQKTLSMSQLPAHSAGRKTGLKVMG